jgi:hypothetical protein
MTLSLIAVIVFSKDRHGMGVANCAKALDMQKRIGLQPKWRSLREWMKTNLSLRV